MTLPVGEVVAEQAALDGHERIAILGTEWTMTRPVYPLALAWRGLGWEIPDEADWAEIHRIIFDELCLGEVREASRDLCRQQPRRLSRSSPIDGDRVQGRIIGGRTKKSR